MDLEFENKSQDQAAEQQNESSREGYGRTAGSYSYHATGRPHRPRINSQRAYSSDRGSASNTEGGFRPEGFGAGLQSNNERPQRGGYQSRQQGGYNSNRGGYQSRGGYGNSRGGYQ